MIRFLLLIALMWPLQARANEGCLLLWDIMLVARAMAEEGAPHGQIAGTLRRIYNVHPAVIGQIATVALASQEPARDYAARMRQECEGAKPRPGKTPLGA